MLTWATNEEETAANLNAALPDGYTATVIGGRNSNSKGDIATYREEGTSYSSIIRQTCDENLRLHKSAII